MVEMSRFTSWVLLVSESFFTEHWISPIFNAVTVNAAQKNLNDCTRAGSPKVKIVSL